MRKNFATHKQYGESSEQQKKHNRDLVLLIAKASLPLSIVDNPYFLKYVHGRNPRVKVPNRRKLTEILIPEFIQECTDKFIRPKLDSFVSVTITFDLWMSRGCQDIFDLIVHGMDGNFNNQQVHLKMIECNATTGIALASALEEELRTNNLLSKVIACVKDGGGNLSVCTNILKSITSCDSMGISACFDGTCFAHILSGVCNAALSSDVCTPLAEIDISKSKSTLQRCITWTKKSGKGREEWYKACRETQMKERLMPTPVKTRFVSTVTMFTMMLKYRGVVEHCFSKQPNIKLRERVPSMRVWEIIRVAAETLEPIMYACIKMQKKGSWLLSDAVAELCELHLYFNGLVAECATETLNSGIESFETQLKLYQGEMAKIIVDKLYPVLAPLFEFRKISDRYVHHYLCLALDPEFKTLREPFMKMHSQNAQAARALAKRYDEEVIIPLLLRLKGVSPESEVRGDGNRSVFSGLTENGTQLQVNNETNGNESQSDDGLECFIDEQTESHYEQQKRSVVGELSSFRREPFNSSESSKQKWMTSKKEKFPTIMNLAQHILGIPPTQIDNERIFSCAGKIASPLRSSISTANIDNLVCISKNYPEENVSKGNVDISTVEEFSDFLIANEVTTDEPETENE